MRERGAVDTHLILLALILFGVVLLLLGFGVDVNGGGGK